MIAANMMRPMPSSNGIVKTKPGRDFRWSLLYNTDKDDFHGSDGLINNE